MFGHGNFDAINNCESLSLYHRLKAPSTAGSPKAPTTEEVAKATADDAPPEAVPPDAGEGDANVEPVAHADEAAAGAAAAPVYPSSKSLTFRLRALLTNLGKQVYEYNMTQQQQQQQQLQQQQQQQMQSMAAPHQTELQRPPGAPVPADIRSQGRCVCLCCVAAAPFLTRICLLQRNSCRRMHRMTIRRRPCSIPLRRPPRRFTRTHRSSSSSSSRSSTWARSTAPRHTLYRTAAGRRCLSAGLDPSSSATSSSARSRMVTRAPDPSVDWLTDLSSQSSYRCNSSPSTDRCRTRPRYCRSCARRPADDDQPLTARVSGADRSVPVGADGRPAQGALPERRVRAQGGRVPPAGRDVPGPEGPGRRPRR